MFFERILLEIGFNFIKCFLYVYLLFEVLGVGCCFIFFLFVMEFYKIFSNEDFFCCIGLINVDVGEMFFKNVDCVMFVFKYCKDDKYFLVNLLGFFLFVI